MMDFARRRRRLQRGLRLSIQQLAAHRLRTALSVSGLTVGVATVLVMVAVAEGAKRRVVSRLQAMGTNLVIVSAAPVRRIAGRERQTAVHAALRPEDADAIVQASTRAVAAAASVSSALTVRHEDRNVATTIVGTTLAGLRIRNIRAATGRLFDETEDRERRRVVLLGPTVARNIFGDEDPIGRDVRIGAAPFEVIAVLRARGTDAGGTDLDDAVTMPLQTAMRRLLNIPYVHALFVQARSSTVLDALADEVREILLQRHPVRSGVEQPFVIQNQAVLLRTERESARALNRVIVGVALLALLVGGIGVLAVIRLSMRERVVEIGLRRAVGARRSDIRLQFILESALLAVLGGTTGVLVGLVCASAAALAGAWDLVVPWRAAMLGLVSSAIVGLAAGAIPAARAARLEPVQALRTE